jgi:hypothetical protein
VINIIELLLFKSIVIKVQYTSFIYKVIMHVRLTDAHCVLDTAVSTALFANYTVPSVGELSLSTTSPVSRVIPETE